MNKPEGNAIVYCEGAFNTPNGKTAHGLVRFTKRYNILAVIDSKYTGQDASYVLDGKEKGIPITASLNEAVEINKSIDKVPTHLVIGLAPDGGRLNKAAKRTVEEALNYGLNVDSGLHDFLTDDKQLIKLAKEKNIKIRDVRKPVSRNKLHFFEGKIEKVDSLIIAILGTDSAIGKRTTAWIIVNELNNKNIKAEMIGTGQTAWMQGAKYSVIMDSIVNDFVSGEIENAVYEAWKIEKPKAIIIEGQGSLMNPAYPGGFEILAAGRPDIIILQHAPARKEYDGFPGYVLHPLDKQIQAIELLSGKPVIAVTINHENLELSTIPRLCNELNKKYNLPFYDVLLNGADDLIEQIITYIPR
ncbi:MAG: DUF1611 domain-containing protein [Ignavibacteriaceae bacterium]|jgi:uncharacterized NAD-dependent epimerase/dehydratase family protein